MLSFSPPREPEGYGLCYSHFTDEAAEVQEGAVIWATQLVNRVEPGWLACSQLL